YSTGVDFPDALAFDSSGNLYVANEGNSTVEKFAVGSTTASATYSAGVAYPEALAFDSSGNLYVGNATNNTVEKFAPGSTTPSATYSAGVSGPEALAFDASGNLYVANANNSTVEKFAPGSTTPSATYSAGVYYPRALAFDSSGNLYVANTGNVTVEKFGPGSTTPSATFSAGISYPIALAFDSSGNLYVANYFGSTVEEFAPGSATATAGGVVIQSSVESRPMLVGGTNSSPVAGINLTTAELAQIFTTSTGTVTIGDGQQTGNITFSTATPATTAGASLDVIQSTTGAGQIILDDASGSGTGLNGNGGLVSLTLGTGGIQTTLFSTGTPLASQGFSTSENPLNLSLGFAPTIGAQLTVVDNTATPAGSNLISGTFSNLAQNATVALSYLGTSYTFQADYQGGSGNDLVLTDLGIATATTVSGASGPSTYGQSVTFTATVAAGGSAVTSGSVTFEEGSTVLASNVSLNASGMAAFAISTLTVGASPHEITAIYNAAGQYITSDGSANQTISKAHLTVTANPASRLYGAADPTFTATISGFANGETLASSGVSGAASLTSNDTATSPVGGTYTITAALGSLVANNYDFTTFVTAALTVDQAHLTVTANPA
ncbi:MAG TPA: MBG domain-containing protein, partial [Pirellulales bacterium]